MRTRGRVIRDVLWLPHVSWFVGLVGQRRRGIRSCARRMLPGTRRAEVVFDVAPRTQLLPGLVLRGSAGSFVLMLRLAGRRARLFTVARPKHGAVGGRSRVVMLGRRLGVAMHEHAWPIDGHPFFPRASLLRFSCTFMSFSTYLASGFRSSWGRRVLLSKWRPAELPYSLVSGQRPRPADVLLLLADLTV